MKRLHLSFPALAVLATLLLLGPAFGQQPSASHLASAPNAADYVGSDTCALCHADLSKNFADNPHSKIVLMHGGTGTTCESCHGPGQARTWRAAET